MFERFSAEARQVVVAAQNEALLLHHGFIGCEHLLLGLSAGAGTPAAASLAALGLDTGTLRQRVADLAATSDRALDAGALATLGIDLDAVRRATEERFGRGALDRGTNWRGRPCTGGHLPFTPQAKKALEVAAKTAAKRHDHALTTVHLLLGLLGQGDNAALLVLKEAGAGPDALRQELAKRMAA
jgi:ATP-dependent Clp protease ATP-binding subunit ClpA